MLVLFKTIIDWFKREKKQVEPCYVIVNYIDNSYVCWDKKIYLAASLNHIEDIIIHLVPKEAPVVFDNRYTGYLTARLIAYGYRGVRVIATATLRTFYGRLGV